MMVVVLFNKQKKKEREQRTSRTYTNAYSAVLKNQLNIPECPQPLWLEIVACLNDCG